MNIKTCEKKENNEAEIIVEVSPDEFESAISKAFIKNRNRIMVPGFRKGKAPRKIIERMYGASTFHPDALEIILPDVATFAEAESALRIVGRPEVTDVDFKEETGGIDVTVTASVYPEVKLGEYKGLSIDKPDTEVPESAVDAEIASIRLRNARIETVDRSAIEGDTAIIDFEGFLDGVPFDGGKGSNHELELGSGSFIPGFEEKLVGMKPGDESDIDLVFPENYVEHLAGKAVVFKVKINEIREKLLPDLDDEFAKDVSEFDSFKDYKADVRERLEKTKQEDADDAFESALMEKVVDSMEVEIPEAMVEEQLDVTTKNFVRQLSVYGMRLEQYFQATGSTPEAFKESMRIKAVKQLKATIALERIAELEGVEVSSDEIETEYKEISERYNQDIDKLRETVPEKEVIKDLMIRHAVKIVKESAVASTTSEKKPTAKKTAAKKTTAKASEGEQASDETAADEIAEKKPAAKKPAVKKAAAKKAADTPEETKGDE